MIHNAECHIVIDPPKFGALQQMIAAEPPIPTDEEISDVFPEWQARAKIFLARALKEENRNLFDQLLPQELFKYGVKFAIVEAKKML